MVQKRKRFKTFLCENDLIRKVKIACNLHFCYQLGGSLVTPSMAGGGQRAPGHRSGDQRTPGRCSAHAEQEEGRGWNGGKLFTTGLIKTRKTQEK